MRRAPSHDHQRVLHVVGVFFAILGYSLILLLCQSVNKTDNTFSMFFHEAVVHVSLSRPCKCFFYKSLCLELDKRLLMLLQVPAGGGLHRHYPGCKVSEGPSSARTHRGGRWKDRWTCQYWTSGEWYRLISKGQRQQSVRMELQLSWYSHW